MHGRLTSVIDTNSTFNGRRLLLVMRHPEGRCIGKRSRCRCVDLKVIASGSSVAALTEGPLRFFQSFIVGVVTDSVGFFWCHGSVKKRCGLEKIGRADMP